MLFIELDVRFSILFLPLLEPVLGSIYCFCFLLDLTSGLSFSPSRLIFKLVPILKLGDDISILLL